MNELNPTSELSPSPKSSLRKHLRRSLIVISCLAGTWLLFMLGLMLYIHHYGSEDRGKPADVIVVLGAGIRPNGTATPGLGRRSAKAAYLWHQGYAPIILCSGGITPGFPRSEAEACQEILIRLGVPTHAITLEEESRSTEENAIYTQDMMQQYGWETAVIVTDSYHAFRSTYLFRDRYGMTITLSPVPYDQITSTWVYLNGLFREVLALHWQVFKDTLGLPFTHVP